MSSPRIFHLFPKPIFLAVLFCILGLTDSVLSSPQLQLTDSVITNGKSLAISIAGDVLYLSDGIGGVRRFSLANPEDPAELPGWSVPNCSTCGVFSTSVDRNKAYVTSNDGHLRIIDFGQLPPFQLADLSGEWLGTVLGVVSHDTLLFHFVNERLAIADFSIPTQPKVVSTLGNYDDHSVAVVENRLFVSREVANAQHAGIEVFDISDPASPQLLSFVNGLPERCYLESGGPHGPQVVCLGGGYGVEPVGEFVYFFNPSVGLVTADFSDLTNPTVNFDSTNLHSGYLFAHHGNTLLQANYIWIHSYDIQNPQSPIYFEATSLSGVVFDLQVYSDYLYVANHYGLWTYHIGTAVAVDDVNDALPNAFGISQNYPNPFNAGTVIDYAVDRHSQILIEVYNILGQKVKTLVNENKMPGRYRAEWDGNDAKGSPVASGVYLYKIKSDNFAETRKMLLLK